MDKNKTDWKDVLGWDEDEINDLRFVGYSYVRQGHYTIALKFFEAIAVLEPMSAYDLQMVGALYLQLGENLKALTYIDRSLAINHNQPHTLLNRAKALLLLGYHKQGLSQAKKLQTNEDKSIVDQAEAILLAYS